MLQINLIWQVNVPSHYYLENIRLDNLTEIRTPTAENGVFIIFFRNGYFGQFAKKYALIKQSLSAPKKKPTQRQVEIKGRNMFRENKNR